MASVMSWSVMAVTLRQFAERFLEQIALTRERRITGTIDPKRGPRARFLLQPPDRQIRPLPHDLLPFSRMLQKAQITIPLVGSQRQIERLPRPKRPHVGFCDPRLPPREGKVPPLP